MKTFLSLTVIVFLLFAHGRAEAGFQAKRIDGKQVIKLDGQLDEKVWQQAVPHDTFYQTQPTDQRPAHLKTEVRILFDDEALYVGIKAYDSDPSSIRNSFSRRDRITIDQDFFALYIDPTSAHKSAQIFYVNARGTVMDGIYSDAAGEDSSPDFNFDVATARFEGGWSAEYRIPFSSIAYDKESHTPWSLLVLRNMTRDQRYRMYSGGVTRATNCNLCYSDTIDGLNQLPSDLSWSLTPQLVVRQASDQFVGQNAQHLHDRQFSLDFKIRPNSATTLDLTLNPDFSQIELDSPQLSGNTRFSIFVQEKRPFFLEGADILRTPFNVISTRSISDPDAGLRYTRRDAQSDVSVIVAKDAAGGAVLIPSTYYSSTATATQSSLASDARANWRFDTMSLGLVATDREYTNINAYNRVFGPDFVWQIDRNQGLRAQLLLSATTAQANEKGELAQGALSSGHALYAGWSKGSDAWSVGFSARDISKDFRADNGFFSQVGFQSVNNDLTKKWGRLGIWHEFNTYVSSEYKLDSEGNILSKSIAPGMNVAGPFDSSVYLNFNPVLKSRANADGEIYNLSRVSTGFAVSPGKQIARISGDFMVGDVIDYLANRLGKGGSASLGAKLRPFDRLEFDSSFATNWINAHRDTVSGEKAYSETAIQINSVLHFSEMDTLRIIIQDARTNRNPELYATSVAPESSRTVNSLVFTRRVGLGTAGYLGWTQTKSETPGFVARRKQSEIFAKLSWQI